MLLDRTRTKTSENVWESGGAHIYIIVPNKCTVAHIMVTTAPQLTILIVWSDNDVTILGNSNDLSKLGRIVVQIVDGESKWIRHAVIVVRAHLWGNRVTCQTLILLEAWRPEMVVILLGWSWMGEADIQVIPLCLNCINLFP